MRIVTIILIALVVVSCKMEPPKMQGAYSMLSANIKGDTTDFNFSNPRQLKIYTEEHMMYANFNPTDSVASFGVATFAANDKGVTETVIYSANDSSVSTSGEFKLEVEKTANGYKQVIRDIEVQNQKLTLSEEYESVGDGTTSPLDGAWMATMAIRVQGTDTTRFEIVQYKTYQSGNFIFAHTVLDSLRKTSTGMGFGTFTMNGEGNATETIKGSNYSTIIGQSFDLSIAFAGPDEYTQTIVTPEGVREIETYKRLSR